MKILGVLLITVFLLGCGPSKREVELESQLKKSEQQLEKSEERLANAEENLAVVIKELAEVKKKEQIQAQKEIEELKKQQSKIKIDGTVFVKTKGGENFKLALIPIGVSTLEEYEAACVSVLSNIASTRTKNTPLIEKNLNEIKTLEPQLVKHFKLWKTVDDKISAFQEKNDGGPYYFDSIIPSEELYYFSRGDGTNIGAKKIVDEYNSYVREAQMYYEKWLPLSKNKKSLRQDIFKMLGNENSNIRNRVRTVVELLQVNGALTRSDADGKFSVELDREKDYVLTGYGERKTGASTEEYNWIVQINIPRGEESKEVFFSNSELVENIPDDQGSVGLTKVRSEKYGPRSPNIFSGSTYCSPYKEIKVKKR